MNDPKKLLLTLVGLNVLWSPVNYLVQISRAAGLSGVALGQLRWTLLAILLGVCLAIPGFRKLTKAVWPTPKLALTAAAIGLCFFAPAHILYYTSLRMTTSIEGTVLLTTAPLWTGLMSFFILRENITPQRVAALVLAVGGAYVVSYGFKAPTFSGNSTGNLLFLSAVIIECLGGVFAAVLVRKASGITVLWFQILGAVPLFWIAPKVLPGQLEVIMQPQAPAFMALFYLVVICGLITFSTWYVLVERAPLSLMVLAMPIQPPISAFLAWLNHEKLTIDMLWGTLIIFGALAVGFSEKGSKEKTSAANLPTEV